MDDLLKRLREMYPTAEIRIYWRPDGDVSTVTIDNGKEQWNAGHGDPLKLALQMAVRPMEDTPF